MLLQETDCKVAAEIFGMDIDPFHPQMHFDKYGHLALTFGDFK